MRQKGYWRNKKLLIDLATKVLLVILWSALLEYLF